MFQDGLQDGLRESKITPISPKKPPRRPNELPRGPPRGREEAKIIDFPEMFERYWKLLLLGIPRAQNGPKRALRSPKKVPKRAA
eukprot:1901236-Pyramimonas_sp.AAC.1